MGLEYKNLDQRTRTLMLSEIGHDVAAGTLYLSNRLTARGRHDYPDLLRQAATVGTDDQLAAAIQSRLNTHDAPRYLPSGGLSAPRAMSSDAHETLAEGEFNRFYMRALCVRAIEDDISHLIVYRAKAVEHARPESQRKIGQRIQASALLQDLRDHVGIETVLGIPAGPNSGLSVRLP
jgi:hypothetical protein